MYRTASSHRLIGGAVSTAFAAALLAGCASTGAPRSDLRATQAEAARLSSQHAQAIAAAEAAVLANPRDAAQRASLAQAYLEAGRFASAATTFDDAIALGDQSPRTALSAAIALIGAGRQAEATSRLDARASEIAPSDLGLALALAGQPDRGVAVMSNAIRAGRNDAKTRQNLAYAYALAGRWREARLMAAQDVPADQVGERMEQWAMSIAPEAWQSRIAGLIGAPAGVADAGQPIHLALADAPAEVQLAASDANEELAPLVSTVAEPAPTPPTLAAALAEPTAFQDAFVVPTASAPAVQPIAQDARLFVEAPAQPVPAAPPASAKAQGTHLVQLGSFASERSAHRAWDIYVKRYPELAGHQMVITEAVVRGKNYWRVSAAGYDRAGSAAMCGRVKSRGEGCFAYADGRPLPGAIDRGTRLAMR